MAASQNIDDDFQLLYFKIIDNNFYIIKIKLI